MSLLSHDGLRGVRKNAVFGGNNARLHGYTAQQRAALDGGTPAAYKGSYEREGAGPHHLAYG